MSQATYPQFRPGAYVRKVKRARERQDGSKVPHYGYRVQIRLDGKRLTKFFSCTRYGEPRAEAMAYAQALEWATAKLERVRQEVDILAYHERRTRSLLHEVRDAQR